MKSNKIFLTIVFICIFALGILSTLAYQDITNHRILNGLYLENNQNWTTAFDKANNLENGDWVCVNIKGMNYQTAIKTCSHETAHEIFAENCEKDIEKCMEIANGNN